MNCQYIKTGNKSLLIILAFVLLVFFVFLIAWVGVDIQNKIKEREYIGKEGDIQSKISVSASGKVYANPNLAMLAFSVITEAKTASKAISENAEKMNRAINFLKDEDIKSADLKTMGFNIYPRYEWYEKDGTYSPQGERVLASYEVRQTLEVKVRDLAKVGALIQGVVGFGINQVGDLRFIVEDTDALKSEARGMAIEKAKAKAEKIACQLGVELIKISNFTENSVIPRYYGLEKAIGMGGGAEDIIPQIETGENEIEVTVSIIYEIN